MTQQPLFVPASGGLETRLLHRREDPQTSVEAARKIVKKATENHIKAAAVVRCYGPGTTWELATRYMEGPARFTAWDRWSVADVHYFLARRLPEAEDREMVSCDRVRDVFGKTFSQVTKVCSVKGTRQAVWRLA